MEIKIATNQDQDFINNLYRACSNDMIERLNLNHWENPYPQETLRRRIENELVYIVSVSDENIGTFMLETEYPIPFKEAVKIDDTPFRYLTRLAVSPNVQAQGIGSRIMSLAEHIAKKEGAEVMRLDILGQYKKLQQFYLKNGYHVIGEGQTRRFTIKFMEKEL